MIIVCKNASKEKDILLPGIVKQIVLLFLGFLFIYIYAIKKKFDDNGNSSIANSVLQRVQQADIAQHTQYQDWRREQLLDKVVAKRFDQNFDFSKCKNGFKIYIHPVASNDEVISINYRKILTSIRKSRYITNNPHEACLFVTSIDTLDRDRKSKSYVKDVDKKLRRLIHWNNGQNHLIFLQFIGTSPHYYDNDLNFNFGKAILVKASASLERCRKEFDISFPLLPKNNLFQTMLQVPSLPNEDLANNSTSTKQELFPLFRKYLLVFKGKRYLFGVGSESRNVLRLLNNFNETLLLTTCRHGNDWQKYKDDNCDFDNEQYDRYDYNELLSSSTFCLVPRGRRLGSFRFLEVLKYGCIPVLLSNGWDLPFSEVLDWSTFSINIDERLVMKTLAIIKDISEEKVLSMKQQVIFVWESYFSSIQKNIDTVVEVLKERIYPHKRHSYLVWNSYPGALQVSEDYSSSLRNYPFYIRALGATLSNKFTVVISVVTPIYKSSSRLIKLVNVIDTSKYVDQIILVWLCSCKIPTKSKLPQTNVPLHVIRSPSKVMSKSSLDTTLVNTESIFTFDEDVQLFTSDQIDFAFSVWRSNPSRLVGFNTATHVYNITSASWKYSSQAQVQFSIVSLTCAIFHKYYYHHYKSVAPKEIRDLVKNERKCESLAMNFLISQLTNYPPIKVTHASKYWHDNHAKQRLEKRFESIDYIETQQKCFDKLVEIYSGLPLVHSKVAANPVSYKMSRSNKSHHSIRF